MEAVKLHAVAAFAAGLIVTLFLAAHLTPRAWWRRPNARALFIMVAGAWGFGSLILYATHGQPAVAAEPAAAVSAVAGQAEAGSETSAPAACANAIAPQAGQPFRVHRDLNLRAAPGVSAARIAIVPAGADVIPTGACDGDWWQIKTILDDTVSAGWVSSLWLRRSGE
ncbi:SH3 domain-containing protein [Duganella sp. P38]|uniref:SH3 domain-containing protein n=1 Tax=Duganella sp. P38 TaxID=3423949 RepID=UPI003D7BD200